MQDNSVYAVYMIELCVAFFRINLFSYFTVPVTRRTALHIHHQSV